MVCSLTCLISIGLIISMIYFYNASYRSPIVRTYRSQLSKELQNTYDNIVQERRSISTNGYIIGLLISALVILYNQTISENKMEISSLVCLVIVISFFTNYFYYILSPKSDWILNHIENKEQSKLWLEMYRTMQYNYHFGMVLGILAVGGFAFAFRC